MDEKSRENAKWNFTIFVLIRRNFSLVLQLIFFVYIFVKSAHVKQIDEY